MTRVIVVFMSRYGNTKRVAKKIIEGINQVGEVKAPLKELRKVDLNTILDRDAILIGSPNHVWGPTRGIKASLTSSVHCLWREGSSPFSTLSWGKTLRKLRRKWKNA